MPHTSSVPLPWRLKKHRYGLIGTTCNYCHAIYFPPRFFCPDCRKKDGIKERKLTGSGEILSFTTINAAPKGFENQAPYTIAVIKLDDGPVITAQIVESAEKISIGKHVSAVFRKIHEDGHAGLITYGLKFKINK
ncbi:MAG: Zn-ribbon domain-containing OB-fold protein [Candidatus Aenigmarchaeota archaeon]|nr:Zn-ribbon domain-containing OB-fold protein [Candidatus Aenigmarchaeota archaeon]